MNRKDVAGTLMGVAAFTVVGLLKLLSEREPAKYTRKWFDSLPDSRLDEEREIVRQEFCSAGGDIHAAVKYEGLLRIFDDVIRKRRYGDCEDTASGSSVHREHGWYLPNDD